MTGSVVSSGEVGTQTIERWGSRKSSKLMVIENVTAVVKSIPICNFENNSSASTQHQRNGVVGSDDVRMDCLLQHAQAVLEVDRPEGLAEFRERVAAPHIIDPNGQSLVPPFDTGDQPSHMCRLGLIHSYGNAAPAGGRDQFSGFFDSFRSAGCGGPSPCSSR